MYSKIKNTPLFKDVKEETIISLISKNQITEVSYNKNKTVHEQQTKCVGLDIVCSGKLVAYALTSNGSETVMFEFAENSIIGANLLFGEQSKYPMNIYCTADCTLFHITKEAVAELLTDYGFVMPFVKALSLNAQGMNKKVMYTHKSLRDNLIDYFSLLSIQQKSKTIKLTISKKQLADRFSVQRPSLFRELKYMKDDGIIEIDNRHITLYFS